MSSFKIKTFSPDFLAMRSRVREQIANEVRWEPATARTPGAVWCDVSNILDSTVRQQLSVCVGRPLHSIFWLCDYRGCKDLEIHRDNPGNEYTIDSRFTIIMMLDGVFEMTIWSDDQKDPIDKAVIHPGEFIVLNNSQYYHSGKVLSGNKLSLHAYPVISEIDGKSPVPFKFDVEKYV